MKLAAAAVFVVLVATSCASAGESELANPSLGDYPESLALVDDPGATGSSPVPASDAESGEADAAATDDMVATVDEVYGETDDDSGPLAIDFGTGVGDIEACTAVVDLVVATDENATDVAEAFVLIAAEFENPVLEKLEAALLGDTSAAADLFLDPGGVIHHLRLDAATFDACGAPLFAGTIGDAAPAAGPGDCFRATALDNSAKVAVGAELNEDLFAFTRVDCAA